MAGSERIGGQQVAKTCQRRCRNDRLLPAVHGSVLYGVELPAVATMAAAI
jgi:hypothetical protein